MSVLTCSQKKNIVFDITWSVDVIHPVVTGWTKSSILSNGVARTITSINVIQHFKLRRSCLKNPWEFNASNRPFFIVLTSLHSCIRLQYTRSKFERFKHKKDPSKWTTCSSANTTQENYKMDTPVNLRFPEIKRRY